MLGLGFDRGIDAHPKAVRNEATGGRAVVTTVGFPFGLLPPLPVGTVVAEPIAPDATGRQGCHRRLFSSFSKADV